jgi:hypothetical protein
LLGDKSGLCSLNSASSRTHVSAPQSLQHHDCNIMTATS